MICGVQQTSLHTKSPCARALGVVERLVAGFSGSGAAMCHVSLGALRVRIYPLFVAIVGFVSLPRERAHATEPAAMTGSWNLASRLKFIMKPDPVRVGSIAACVSSRSGSGHRLRTKGQTEFTGYRKACVQIRQSLGCACSFFVCMAQSQAHLNAAIDTSKPSLMFS